MLHYGLSELDYLDLNKGSRSLDLSGCRKTLKLALLSDSAPQYLTPLFKTLLAKNGVRAEIYEASYDTMELEILDPGSGLHAFRPDTVVILPSVQALRDRYNHFSGDKTLFAEEQAERFTSLWKKLRAFSGASVIQGDYVLPNEKLFGNYEDKAANSFYHTVVSLNRALRQAARPLNHVFISDIDHVAAYHGRRHWLDEKMWILCKAFCAFEFLPHAVQNIVDTLLSLAGEGVKCIVLDLDNTLWGGIIGDDGLEGIRIGHFEDGEAFQNFQYHLLALKDRGILLAVCSKNDLETALRPFREHPEMVLREKDIAVFVANWSSKAENIRTISRMLNIGCGSMAFIDDNLFERGVVRDAIPEMIVPELPDDPADYVRCLTELNLFETTAISALDTDRAELYRIESRRKLGQVQFEDPKAYLESLEMTMTCGRFDPFHLPRIAQLLQRSNQFNLLTRRYAESQCEAFMKDEQNWFPMYLSLKDKYGDNGLISAVIARFDSEAMNIEEWVMSCRVLARGVEQYAMNTLFEEAAKRGVRKIRARYEPTEKNGMVRDLYERLGFRRTGGSGDGPVDWEIDAADYRPQSHFIRTAHTLPGESV